jgi:hypothetical protein
VARYSTKQPVTVSTTVRDRTGALVDAGTLALTVVKPDATTQVYSTPVRDSLGTYHQDIPVADLGQIGHYQYEWVSTGTGAGESFGDFDVADFLAETAVLPLQDAKDMLNIAQATTAYDAELQSWIATIETSLEALTGGPLVNRTVTERGELDGTCTILQVQQRPVVSVTSVTPTATGVPADLSPGLDIDPGAGIIRSKLGYRFGLSWDAGVTVVYVAGWGTSVPAAFNASARIILANLWGTQHGPSARPSMGGAELTALPPFPYMIPRGAAELLNGQLNGVPFRCPVFA